jgi:molecular chaperone GrpE (heat shock protein)
MLTDKKDAEDNITNKNKDKDSNINIENGNNTKENNDVKNDGDIDMEEIKLCILLQKRYDKLDEDYKQLEVDYQTLDKNYQTMDQKFRSFVVNYNRIEDRCNSMKADLQKHKDEQILASKVQVTSMLLDFHNSLRIVLEENKDLVVLQLLSNQIDNLLSAWQVEKVCPNEGDEYNPKECQIINSIATEDENLKNCISRVITMGYKIGTKLIKASEVEIYV